jgi:hypothetical protein
MVSLTIAYAASQLVTSGDQHRLPVEAARGIRDLLALNVVAGGDHDVAPFLGKS